MRPLLISGPSGVGKSFLAKYLSDLYDYERVVSTTTRAPRAGEIDGVDYHFVTPDIYQELLDSGELFMSNQFMGQMYGYQTADVTSILERGKRPVTEIYTPVMQQFLDRFPNSDRIFLMPVHLDLLAERMRRRGDREDKIEQRLAEAQLELDHFLQHSSGLYHQVFEVAADEQLQEIIDKIFEIRVLNDSADEVEFR